MAENAKEWLESLSEEQLAGFMKFRGDFTEGGNDDEYVSKRGVQQMIQAEIKKGVEQALGGIMPRVNSVSQSQGMALLKEGLSREAQEYIEATFGEKKDADILAIATDKDTRDMVRRAAKQAAYEKSKESEETELTTNKKTPAAKDAAEVAQHKEDMAKMGITFKDDADAEASLNRVKGLDADAKLQIEKGAEKVAV